MEERDVENAPASSRDEAIAPQHTTLAVPSPPYDNMAAVDSVMSVNKEDQPGVIVEQVEIGEVKTAVTLPQEWGTPFLRRLRCEYTFLP